MMKKRNMDEYLTALSDLLMSTPEGVTIHQIASALGLSVRDAARVVRAFRLLFRDDTVTLVAWTNGQNQPWLYRLAGTAVDAEPWILNRTQDGESRLETMQAVYTPIVANTDGRTVEGRKARIILRAATRALEDLRDMV
jgi:hypothetical protein